MHAAAYAFLTAALSDIQAEATILEIGSYNVNGTARDLCPDAAEYVGIDRRAGPGVDLVVPDDNYDGEGRFSIVISSETLEHAEDPQGVIGVAWNALAVNGVLVITAAGPDRPPHGCDGEGVGNEHYRNIDPQELAQWLSDWGGVKVYHNPRDHDVYAVAVRPLDVAAEAIKPVAKRTKKAAA